MLRELVQLAAYICEAPISTVTFIGRGLLPICAWCKKVRDECLARVEREE